VPEHAETRVAVARNAAHLVAGQVGTTVLAILLSATLGRSLGPADFGLYFLVLSTSQFAFVVVEWGQLLYVVREIARDPAATGRFLGSALALRAAGAALIVGPVGLVTWALGYEARTCWYAVAFVAASLPFSLASGFGLSFRGHDRMGLEATVSVTNKAFVLALTLAAFSLGMGIPGVMVAQGVAGLVAVALAFRLHAGLGAGRLAVDRPTARRILVGGLPILFMLITVSVQPYIDVVILSKLVPPAVVGWYGAAKNVMGTLTAPALIMGAAWYPRLSRVSDDPSAFKRELRSAIRPLLWLGALGGIGTYQFADVAIGLIYGLGGYGPATVVLKVFGVGLFLLFVDVLLGHVITASGRSTGFAIAKFASVLVATGLQLLLVPWFQANHGNGGIGVVVAFSLSEIVVFAGSVYLMPRGSLGAVLLLEFGRAIAAAAVAAGLYALLPPLSPIVGIPLLVALFAAASFGVGLVNRSDVALLRSVVRKRG